MRRPSPLPSSPRPSGRDGEMPAGRGRQRAEVGAEEPEAPDVASPPSSSKAELHSTRSALTPPSATSRAVPGESEVMPDAPTEDLSDLVVAPVVPLAPAVGKVNPAKAAPQSDVPKAGAPKADEPKNVASKGRAPKSGTPTEKAAAPKKGKKTTASSETAPVTPPVDAESAEETAPSLRMRDVWSAARARRRTLRAEMRRFTVRSRRRRLAWIIALGAFVVLVVGTVGAAYSPLLAVREVQVVGTSALDAATVQAALAGQVGTPLPLVDESSVKSVLVEYPLVESYTLEARPPHTLIVRIVERTPIGVVESDAGWSLVDAAGVVLATTQDRPADRPQLTVRGGTGTPAFTSVGKVMRALPADILAQVTAVTATTRDDVTLTLGGTRTQVIWGSVDGTPEKVLALEAAMNARPPDTVTAYDVSSPAAVVIR